MKRLTVLALLVLVTVIPLNLVSAADDNACAAAFNDYHSFTIGIVEHADIKDGVINWQSTDWENVVRRLVGTGEFYLNNCADPDLPLIEQPDMIAQLAALSVVQLPVDSVDVGGDFGEISLSSGFQPVTAFIDLNGDGADELLLHTQVPYFSQETVYQIRGGVSIAFFKGIDGWQGQVIAPITDFVTDETGPHVSFAMSENNTLSVEKTSDALIYLPAPDVRVIDVDGETLTAVTLHSSTATGEARELAIIRWDDRFPLVELRLAFDDWCYPGQSLDWEIGEDGSVFVPSNDGGANSPLHCGQTPEILFQWQNDHYVAVE